MPGQIAAGQPAYHRTRLSQFIHHFVDAQACQSGMTVGVIGDLVVPSSHLGAAEIVLCEAVVRGAAQVLDRGRRAAQQVLDDAHFQKLAVEGDLSALADQGDPDIRRADAGQPFQFGEWIVNASNICHPLRVGCIQDLHLIKRYGIKVEMPSLYHQTLNVQGPVQPRATIACKDAWGA